MKKVLLGTTALVMTAGAAAAEVSLSGYAEIGIRDAGASDVELHSDMDVSFSLSGESDNGLSFGAKIDLDEVSGGIPADSGSDAVWVSGSFGTITIGDTDGGFDWAMSEVGALTAITDDHTTHAGFAFNSGLDGINDGQVLRYDNSVGDLAFALSAELDDAGAGDGDAIGVGVKASFGDISVGVGMQESDTYDVAGISLGMSFGDVSATINYSDGYQSSTNTDDTHMGIGVTYTSGALSLHANYGEFDNAGDDGFGLAANYDLGGGAVAMFGYGSDNGAGDAFWSAGLGLSF